MFLNLFKSVKPSKDSLSVEGRGNADLHEELMSVGNEAKHSKAMAYRAREWGCSEETIEAIRNSARENT